MFSYLESDVLIINEEDLEHHSKPEPTFSVLFDPNLDLWGGYRIKSNQIVFGKKALMRTPESNYGAIRHEKTHGVFYSLPPNVQMAVCQAFTAEVDPAQLVAFCLFKIGRGDPEKIYKREYWMNPESQQEFHTIGRGMFADIEIEYQGEKYFAPQIISEILAYLAVNNKYNLSSPRANTTVPTFVAMATSMLEAISPQTLELLKTSGLLFITGTKEFESLQQQITDLNITNPTIS